MINTIFQWIFLVGFLWILFNRTRDNIKASKAQQRLAEIERLVKIASETKDEPRKSAMKERIFDKLEEEL